MNNLTFFCLSIWFQHIKFIEYRNGEFYANLEFQLNSMNVHKVVFIMSFSFALLDIIRLKRNRFRVPRTKYSRRSKKKKMGGLDTRIGSGSKKSSKIGEQGL